MNSETMTKSDVILISVFNLTLLPISRTWPLRSACSPQGACNSLLSPGTFSACGDFLAEPEVHY
jgi:hypothetical protein